MSDRSILEQLVRETPALWCGRSSQHERPGENAIDTGFPRLNELLPTRGWPLGTVVELTVDAWGSGELQLLLPLMARLSQDQTRVAMVAPPHLPYAPALVQAGVVLPYLVIVDTRVGPLDTTTVYATKNYGVKDTWWSAEKLLRHADCGLVLLWPDRPNPAQVRRLQLAADAANSIGVIFRCGRPVDTPVTLRLNVSRCVEGVRVELTKSRFGWRQQGEVVLPQVVDEAVG